ncbi:MAG: LacI family DNA-binding transcriptional regulator [Xanthomonadales bacterium]|nr:LacI family DNA-binding transcriptional regulator [Xanthomonadales bacterium]
MTQVSIKQVAKIAGVSIATVSRCINNPQQVRERTRVKVQAAILKTGYSPNTIAQSFRRGRTNVIMVVIPSIGDPFFTEVMQGIRSVVAQNDYSIIISETNFNTMTAEEVGAMMVSRQADGFILLASVFPFGNEVLEKAQKRSQPVVIGCETISASLADIPSVHIDNVAAAREATDFLISKGHKKIAFISGQSTSLLTRDREFGYRTAMQKAQLPVEDGWVVEGNLSIEGAAHACKQLLEHPDRPTAVFCANDEMALGFMHQIKEQGLSVPKDISVMGFDDIRYASVMEPALTTIAQPARQIGERVAIRLFKAIETGNQPNSQPVILPHKLIIRESVAAPGV